MDLKDIFQYYKERNEAKDQLQILVIEEKIENRIVADYDFNQCSDKLNIEIAYSLKEALVSLTHKRFDLALLDMEIRHPDDVKTIMSILTNLSKIPYWVITESVQHKFLFDRMDLGTEFYIARSKFNLEEFQSKIAMIIQSFELAKLKHRVA